MITRNRASNGAGIHVDGGLVTLRDSVGLTENTASGYLGGGALFLKGSILMVPDTKLSLTLHNNQGNNGMTPSPPPPLCVCMTSLCLCVCNVHAYMHASLLTEETCIYVHVTPQHGMTSNFR
jgi:hypothetical protein